MNDQIGFIGETITDFKWAIGYEKFNNLADELKVKALGFQTTRFVQNKLRVYSTIFRIFSHFLCLLLQKILGTYYSHPLKTLRIIMRLSMTSI